MTALSTRGRQLAERLAQHAASVLPNGRSPGSVPWAEAMRRELDYIEDDAGAVRWALGCIFASYRARLTHRPWFSARTAWRQVAASGALMLVIGFALLDNAGGQTVPPRPAVDETRCDLPSASLPTATRLRCDVSQHCGANAAADVADHPAQPPDPSCADRMAPVPFLPRDRTSHETDDLVH